MMFDEPRPGPNDFAVEAHRLGDRVGQRLDAREISGAIADGLFRPMPEEKQPLAPQVRAGIARDREQIDI